MDDKKQQLVSDTFESCLLHKPLSQLQQKWLYDVICGSDKLVELDGEQGTGKSTMIAMLAAIVATLCSSRTVIIATSNYDELCIYREAVKSHIKEIIKYFNLKSEIVISTTLHIGLSHDSRIRLFHYSKHMLCGVSCDMLFCDLKKSVKLEDVLINYGPCVKPNGKIVYALNHE